MNSADIEVALHEVMIPCHLGWSEEERQHPQLVAANIKFKVRTSGVEKSDQLEDTLDYCDVLSLVETQCKNTAWRLLEKMSFDLASSILNNFAKVVSVEISLRKNIFAHTKGVSVTRFLERD